MLLKMIKINGVKHVTSCSVVGARTLTFYCHNDARELSFTETLPFVDFQERLLTLNARVRFPENVVRDTLVGGEPTQAMMTEFPNSSGIWVLAMKFVLPETPAPLKWEWHIKQMDTVMFFRKLLIDTIDIGHELHVVVQTLTKDLCAKDKELEQYRREGCQLRRTTVRTKTFDLVDFNNENKDLLEEATAYNELVDVFPSSVESSTSREVSVSSSVPTTPSSAASSSPSTISPSSSNASSGRPASSSARSSASSSSSAVYRSRKRRARALNIERLERNIKQRMQSPGNNNQVQFNSQSSQEDHMAEWLVEGALNNNGGGTKQEDESESDSESKPALDLTLKPESPEAEAEAAAEAAATVKTEKEKEEEPEKAITAPKIATIAPKSATPAPEIATVKTEKEAEPEKAPGEENNNNESLTESDQELNELRAILAASMAQKREQREK